MQEGMNKEPEKPPETYRLPTSGGRMRPTPLVLFRLVRYSAGWKGWFLIQSTRMREFVLTQRAVSDTGELGVAGLGRHGPEPHPEMLHRGGQRNARDVLEALVPELSGQSQPQ